MRLIKNCSILGQNSSIHINIIIKCKSIVYLVILILIVVSVHTLIKWPLASEWPCSLTHWKMWYPPLFSSFKIIPFLQQNTDFSAQNDPLFTIKHWLFIPKWSPLCCGKTLTFQPKWTLLFTLKHRTSTLTPFPPNS